MFQSLTTKNKILIPMFLLTAILIFIGGMVSYINYSKIVSLKTLNKKILFSSKVSSVLHTLQKERGLSCAYVVNDKEKFRTDILLQRKITNIEIKNLKITLNSLSNNDFKKDINRLFYQLALLQSVREEIDNYNISYNNIIRYYSILNAILLDMIVNISKTSHVPIITQNILAYSNFLYLKEYMGIERAQGVTIFSKKGTYRRSLIEFSNTLSLEKRSESIFLKYASENMKQFYMMKKQDTSFQSVSTLENIILYKDIKKLGIDSKKWFDIITESLNTLDIVSNFIKKETEQDIQEELDKLNTVFIVLSTLILVSVLVFILMLVAFFKLAREEQRLRIVMDKYIISSTTDLKGRIIDVSEAFCTISGYSRKELIGKPHNIVRHPDTSKELFRKMWYRLERGLSWSGKVKNKRKDGSFYWVYANVEPLFTSGGNVDSYISIRLDITESELLILKVKEEEGKNKWQEELIREQSRLAQMGEMISMIAHQWRQPLSAISAASGSLQLKAKRNKLTQDTAIDIAEKIKGFSIHLSSTIDDFRNFFKTNKVKTVTDFETILQSVLSIIEGSLEKNKITFNLTIKSTSTFNTFENELKQVILNLIKNAEDALVDNQISEPKIDIIIDKRSFTIRDNAGGIDKKIIEKIFDPYFSTKTKKDGTGLGLYMSKMIVQDHCQGKITATNVADGAEFKIILGEQDD